MPGGREIAVVLNNERVQIRTVPDGNITKEFRSDLSIASISSSPQGDRLAIGGDAVEVWNVSDEPELESTWPHPDIVHSVVFNRAGNRLATSCFDRSARVFAIGGEANSGPLFAPVYHWTELVGGPPVFFPDDVLVTSSDRAVQWRDATTGHPVEEFPDVTLPRAYQLTTSANGEWMAICTRASCEVISRHGERVTHPHPNHVYDAAFYPDGALVTACYDWNSRLFSAPLSDGKSMRLPHLQAAEQCAASADGTLIAVSGDDFVRVWKRPESSRVKVAAPGWAPAQWRPRVSFDGRWVTRGRCHSLRVAGNLPSENLSTLTVLDTTNGQPAGPAIDLDNIVDSCLCADHRTLAVISRTESDGQLSFYDVESGKRTRPPVALASPPHSVAARPEHSQVAVMCEDGEVRVVDTRSEQPVHVFPYSGQFDWFYGRFARVTYTPNGDALIALWPNDRIFVRDADSDHERFPSIDLKLAPRLALCPALDVSPDSQLLATGITGSNAVQVWDLETGNALCPPIPHPGDLWGLYAVRFSPDQKLVLTANKDGVARVWDWRNGTLVCPPLEHPAEVFDVAFLSDGKYGLTIDRADTVRIWELTTGRMITAPIHYPTSDDGFPRALYKVAMVGSRAILGAPEYPILDVAPILREPELSTESLLAIAELISAQRNTRGAASSLDLEQWQATWNHRASQPLRDGLNSTSELLASLRSEARDPSPRSQTVPRSQSTESASDKVQEVAGLLARRLDETPDARGQLRLLERRGVTWAVLEELLALRPDNPHLHLIRARWFEKFGEQDAARTSRQRALVLLEQQLALHPNDPFLARQIAELHVSRAKFLRERGDAEDLDEADRNFKRAVQLYEQCLTEHSDTGAVKKLASQLTQLTDSDWRVLRTTEVTSELGAKLTKQSDDSILASGADLGGRYLSRHGKLPERSTLGSSAGSITSREPSKLRSRKASVRQLSTGVDALVPSAVRSTR